MKSLSKMFYLCLLIPTYIISFLFCTLYEYFNYFSENQYIVGVIFEFLKLVLFEACC